MVATSFFKKDEWYYFSTRTQTSETKIGGGKYSKRKITGDNTDGIDRENYRVNGKKISSISTHGLSLGSRKT